MQRKYFFSFLILFSLFLASNAFATVTISDINLTCATDSPSDANCYTTSDLVLTWKVTDSNNVSPDANGADWNYSICYVISNGLSSCYTVGADSNVSLSSGSLRPTCSTDILGNDLNFVLGRNCSYSWSFGDSYKTDGHYDVNITVNDINSHRINTSGSLTTSFNLALSLGQSALDSAMISGTETMKTLTGYLPIIVIALIMFFLLTIIVALLSTQGTNSSLSIQQNLPVIIFLIIGMGVAVLILIFILVLMGGIFVAVA